MNIGVLLYKCRRCGQIDRRMHVPNIAMALAAIISGPEKWPWSYPTPVGMMDVHICADNNVGVTDLIGAERDKE